MVLRSATVRRLLAPLALLVVFATAACGTGVSATTPSKKPPARQRVSVDDSPGLGEILVNGAGRTLYLFEKDKASSTCTGKCAEDWPPLTTKGKPKAINGAKDSLLGTVVRSGHVKQVTYKGHPLYYYADDKEPGQTNGQDVYQYGGKWYTVSPEGTSIEKES